MLELAIIFLYMFMLFIKFAEGSITTKSGNKIRGSSCGGYMRW